MLPSTLSSAGPDVLGPREDYAAIAMDIRGIVDRELESKGVPAISLALVDDQEIVWAQGFGWADRERSIRASANTVHRVGSVSKLFTDLAVMQLMEQGTIDLDAPIEQYVRDFQPRNPFGKPITLRLLMSHRSGLVREPPVGNYFDPNPVTLAATVLSLNQTSLVYEPDTHTKYSNAAIATVGYVLETLKGRPFAECLRESLLVPLAMHDSSFDPPDELLERTAKAVMWAYDGRVNPAPTFPLGMAPAGSMYSTVTDLGRFMSALLAGGRGLTGQILRPETLHAMWTPSESAGGGKVGFGLGFRISDLQGHRRLGHNGAMYGFATELAFLPDDKLGVVVVVTKDCANSLAQRLADHALASMLALREGRPPPQFATSGPVDRQRAHAMAGRYADGDSVLRLECRADKVVATRGGFMMHCGWRDQALVVDDPLAYGPLMRPLAGGDLLIDGRIYRRMADPCPDPIPSRWVGLIGEYGWDHNTLFIREDEGRLHALIEWFFDYPLQEISENVFAFPNQGLYAGELVQFVRDAAGRATEAVAAGISFKRRSVGTMGGETFRIVPLRPIEELRAEASEATPPAEEGDFLPSDLVDLASLDTTIRLDIRYATTNNFMGSVFYSQPRAFLQRPAAQALARVHEKLKGQGYGLWIYDAYRPWHVTKMFWDATPPPMRHFVADPSQGSRHNRGCAVDLTLYDLATGEPVEMPGGYDEFSFRSYPGYPGGTSSQRWHRELLRGAMESEGFTVYEYEWWHFDYRDWRRYRIMNTTFEELAGDDSLGG